MYNFEELDEETRKWMLVEFLNEENSGNPYRSPRLSPLGLDIFPKEMEKAIKMGDEESLKNALLNPDYWKPKEPYTRGGEEYWRKINHEKAAEFLAYSDFNTWYIKGFSRRLMEDGEEYCQVYRAGFSEEPRGECLVHEDQIYKVEDIYNGHRIRYWPKPGKKGVLSIPVGTNCHHSIKRV